ncbi:serine--tRNA synthetase-like protein Slimp [Toxorhynchites rutilus septentrionalis]|uniref:serine--tRNA synthetase-like protein Slimp n=1 Tax=Toxorhynchites rutilus septentrionalis TaxID=329112 RepID=UPI00247AFF2B|nr:serine--tRNA synthetase-like protein Slimp [Toxorhynchites rutilus septentrionalis]
MLRLRPVVYGTCWRSFSSALYVTGDKAKEQYAPLVPFLDIRSKLSDLERLQENLRLRRYRLDFDQMKQQWELYRSIELRKKNIEARRVELREQIAQAESEDERKRLKLQAVLAKDDLKSLRESSYSIADAFVTQNFLAIPNELHERTPAEERQVLFEESIKNARKLQPVGEECLEPYDSTCSYMTGDAALMDLFLPIDFVNIFQEAGFVLFSNPDFVRSVLVEAAMVDPKALHLVNEEVDLDHKLNLLHLCGGGSMLSFLGYLAKLSVFPTALPLRLVANGKQYFQDRIQTNAVQMLAVTADQTEAVDIFDETIELYKKCYTRFGISYRLMKVPAHELNPAEAMRVDVEMFNPKVNRFIKIGDVCYYSNFLSKRIAFNYHEGKIQNFPHLISGTVQATVDLIRVLLQHGIRLKDLSFLEDVQ